MIIIYILSSHIRNKPENHCTPFSESTGPSQRKGQRKLQRQDASLPPSLPPTHHPYENQASAILKLVCDDSLHVYKKTTGPKRRFYYYYYFK